MASTLCSGHLPVGLSLGRGSLLLAGPLSFPSMPQWLGIHQKRTRVPLSHNNQSRFMIWQIKGFSVSSPSIACKHWVRVDHYIVMDWAHVLVIVQCQSDGCSLSCKDGAVVWQSFGQLAAGCLTILEMAVHFGAISVYFIMRSLRFTILTCFMFVVICWWEKTFPCDPP